jgi:hypothetical protein
LKVTKITLKTVSLFSFVLLLIFITIFSFHGTLAFARGSNYLPGIPEITTDLQRGDILSPLALDTIVTEGFEGGVMPPAGWTRIQTNVSKPWKIYSSHPHTGAYYAGAGGDPNHNPQDEILLSPVFTATRGTVSFWSYSGTRGCLGADDECDLEIYYVPGDWGGGDDVYLGLAEDSWTSNFKWFQSTFDFSAYADGTPAHLAFRYVGQNGEEIGLDDISIDAIYEHFVFLPLLNVPALPSDDWTFMLYLDGDNPQEAAALDEFLEVASVGSTDDVNLLVQLDRITGYDTRFDDWTGTRRYRVTNGMQPTASNALVDLGEVNMGDGQTLVDFVTWGMENYRADNYAVILWDPENGAQEPGLGPVLDVAYDTTSAGDALDLPEIRDALDTLTSSGAKPVDLFGFDADLMSMVEVDAQLIPYAGIRVGSQETEPLDGWPYDTILAALVADSTMTPTDLATEIVTGYYASNGNDQTQSATDLGAAYATLLTKVDDFAVALLNGLATYTPQFITARANTQEFSEPAFIDLYDFAYQVSLAVSDTTIDNAANDLMTAVDNAVIFEQHGAGWPGAHGISIYFPRSFGDYNSNYDGSEGWFEFTADTHWDEWLNAFLASTFCTPLVNCTFEQGRGVGWTESSTHSYPLIVNESELPPGIHPHNGSWLAWLGGDEDEHEVSIITQQVTVPTAEHHLKFWYRIISDSETCGTSYANVLVGSTVVWTSNICGTTHMINWASATVDLNAYAGSSIQLKFKADTQKMTEDQFFPNMIFVDDVSFEP